MTTINTSVRIAVLDSFSSPLKNMSAGLANVSVAASKVGANFDFAAKIGQASEAVGRFADMAKSALSRPVSEFVDFEHQMSKVAAVGDLTGKSFEMLKTQALDLGEATRYSATQAAMAQENLVSAGFDVNEIMKLTPVALQLATAGGLELARASEIVSGTLKGFGKSAGEASNVADILASAAALSAADVEYMAEVFSKAGPVAKTLGIDLETVAASAAVMAEAQIGAAEGGTALKTVMLRLSAPAKAARDAFTSLGFGKKQLAELQAQLGKGDMPGVLKKIGESFDTMGLSAAERVSKLKHIFGDEAVAQASVMIDAAMKTDDHGLRQLQVAFGKVDGAAAKMARRMDNDTAGSLTRLSSAWSGFMIQLGEKMGPALNQMSEQLQTSIGKVGDWVQANPELTAQLGQMAMLTTGAALGLKGIMLFASFAASVGTVLSGAAKLAMVPISALGSWLAGLAPAAWGLGTAVTGITAPILAAGAAALGVGYAIGTLIARFTQLDEVIADALGWITGVKSAGDMDPEGLGKDRQEYADGTVINGKTGEVVKLGNGPAEIAPRVIREARAAGATTVAQINEFTKTGGVQTEARAPGASASPVEPGNQNEALIAAIREQTRLSEKKSAELIDEVRRGRRRSSGGSTGVGEGAF